MAEKANGRLDRLRALCDREGRVATDDEVREALGDMTRAHTYRADCWCGLYLTSRAV